MKMKRLLQIWMFVVCATITGMAQTDSCVITSLPQFWDFESGNTVGPATHPLPACWQRYDYMWPYVGTIPRPTSGSKGLLIYDQDYVSLPPIDTSVFPLNDLQLSFFACKEVSAWTSPRSSLVVGVMTSPSNRNSFVGLDTLTVGSDMRPFDISFSTYRGNGRYISITTLFTDHNLYIDDLRLQMIPACSRPDSLMVSDVQARSVHLDWRTTADTANYTICYKPSSDTSWQTVVTGVTDTPAFTLTGLTPATLYECYVMADCYPDAASSRVSFTTACAGIYAVPKLWNFESDNIGATHPIPICWNRLGHNNTNSVPYVADDGGSMVLQTDCDDTSYAILPYIDIDSLTLNELQVSFYITGNADAPEDDYDLTIGVMTDPADESTFTAVQQVQAYSLDHFQHYTVPFSGYAGSGTYIAFRIKGKCRLDDILVDTISDCMQPSMLTVSHLTANTVTLHWINYGDYSGQILLLHRTMSDTAWISEMVTVDSNSIEMNGLSAATTYEICLAAPCDSTQASNSVLVTTLCNAVTPIPNFWDFEQHNTAGTNAAPLPECWSRTGHFYPLVVDTSASYDAFQGSHYLLFQNNSSTTVALPALDTNVTPISSLILSFYAKVDVVHNDNRLMVGVMDDPTDTSSFVIVDTLTDFLANYRAFDVPLDMYNGFGKHIAFRTCGSVGHRIYVDNVKLELMPGCTRPYGIALEDVNQTSATLSWSHNTDSAWYVVAYKPVDGDMVFYDTTGIIPGPAVSLSGLMANTTYEVRVAASCYPDAFSEPYLFTTLCPVIDFVPQSWDFETNNTGGTTSRPLPECWTRVAAPSSMSGSPYVSSYAGMIHSGSHSLNFWQSRGWYVVLPALADSIQANDLDLAFLWKVSGRWNTCTSSALTVGVMTDPADASTFTALQTLTSADTLFHFVDVSLSAYTDTGKYIAFFDATPVGASGYSDIYIDDLSLEYVPACLRPTDLTIVNLESRTADVVWTSNADSTDYVVFYRDVANPTVWYSDTVAGNGDTLQDLIPNTTYEIYVIALCSPWSPSLHITFRTDCAPDIIAVPQTWDFEEATTGYHVPLCWSRYVGGTGSLTNPPNIRAGYSYAGAQALYFFASSGNMAIMPYVNPDYLDIRELQVSFYIGNALGDENPAATIEVGVITNPEDPSTFTSIQIIDSIGLDFKYVTIPFYRYEGEGTRIAFRDNNPAPNPFNNPRWYSLYLDNVTIDYYDSLPCAVPYLPTASAITDTSVTVSWGDAQHDPKTYLIYYKPSSSTIWQVDTVCPGVLTHTLVGLDYATVYDCYVVAECNPDMPSRTIQFETMCLRIRRLPVLWDFNDLPTGPNLPKCWWKITTAVYPKIVSVSGLSRALQFRQASHASLPEISTEDVDFSRLVFTFLAKSNRADNDAVVEVGLMTDPNDTATFTLVQAVSGFTTAYQTYSIPLVGFENVGEYLAFRHSGDPSICTYIDDVSLHYTDTVIDGLQSYSLRDPAVVLFPNPAHEYIDVRVTDPDANILGIEVFDVYGKVVRFVEMRHGTSPQSRINLSGLADGIYIAHIRTETGIIDLKFIKKQ